MCICNTCFTLLLSDFQHCFYYQVFSYRLSFLKVQNYTVPSINLYPKSNKQANSSNILLESNFILSITMLATRWRTVALEENGPSFVDQNIDF